MTINEIEKSWRRSLKGGKECGLPAAFALDTFVLCFESGVLILKESETGTAESLCSNKHICPKAWPPIRAK